MRTYTLADFDFQLPEELIAQKPANQRHLSRLLVYKKSTKEITHDTFTNIKKYLPPDAVLVFNNSKVLPARVFGTINKKICELLITQITDEYTFTALVRPGKKAKANTEIELPLHQSAKVITINEDGSRVFKTTKPITIQYLEQIGQLPLPPYITNNYTDELASRYQTVYAKQYGSIAAPTAGLHFTQNILDDIKRNHELVEVTLHVGLGTFAPIRSESITDHTLHTEEYEISEKAAIILNQAKQNKHPIIAVGTTSTRTLESALQNKDQFIAEQKATNIFIKPGYEFKAINGLITNFHLPKSSLFILIASLLGIKEAQKVYQEAIKEKYRFYSFGDACLFID